jgi:hypothetical protein
MKEERTNSTEAKLDTDPSPHKVIEEPSSSAQRMRRYRRRLRLRELSVRIEVDQFEIDALVKRGYIEAVRRNDPRAVADGVSAFISDTLVLDAVTT